jgi:putative permease
MRRLAESVAIVLATLLAVYLLWQFRTAVWLFLLSLALAAAVRPLLRGTEGQGIKHTLALLAVYLVGGAGVVLLFYTVGAASADELQRAGNDFVATYDRMWAEWPDGSLLQQTIIGRLPPPNELYENIVAEQLTAILSGMLGVTLNLLDLLSRAVAVVMLSFYWNIDRVRLERLWLSLLAPAERARARDLWRALEAGVGAYVRIELITSVLVGLLLGMGYQLMGLEFPTLLALVGALARFIPWLGVLLAIVPVLVVGLQAGTGVAVLAVLYTLLVFILISLFELRLGGRRYSSLLIVLVMIALADVFGLAGVLLAPPLAAAIQVLVSHRVSVPVIANPADVTHQIADLEERLAMVNASLETAPDPPPPRTAHLAQRLTQLLERARGVMQTADPTAAPSGAASGSRPARAAPAQSPAAPSTESS